MTFYRAFIFEFFTADYYIARQHVVGILFTGSNYYFILIVLVLLLVQQRTFRN